MSTAAGGATPPKHRPLQATAAAFVPGASPGAGVGTNSPHTPPVADAAASPAAVTPGPTSPRPSAQSASHSSGRRRTPRAGQPPTPEDRKTPGSAGSRTPHSPGHTHEESWRVVLRPMEGVKADMISAMRKSIKDLQAASDAKHEGGDPVHCPAHKEKLVGFVATEEQARKLAEVMETFKGVDGRVSVVPPLPPFSELKARLTELEIDVFSAAALVPWRLTADGQLQVLLGLQERGQRLEWSWLGGKAQGAESPVATAVREFWEECGGAAVLGPLSSLDALSSEMDSRFRPIDGDSGTSTKQLSHCHLGPETPWAVVWDPPSGYLIFMVPADTLLPADITARFQSHLAATGQASVEKTTTLQWVPASEVVSNKAIAVGDSGHRHLLRKFISVQLRFKVFRAFLYSA